MKNITFTNDTFIFSGALSGARKKVTWFRSFLNLQVLIINNLKKIFDRHYGAELSHFYPPYGGMGRFETAPIPRKARGISSNVHTLL
jgi:hypothetical protein